MADDMGWSDIRVVTGARSRPLTSTAWPRTDFSFTQFYNTGRCCPTRNASHPTGNLSPPGGYRTWMMSDTGLPWIQRGTWEVRVRTIAEVSQARPSISTYLSGKWHVTPKIQPGSARSIGGPDSVASTGSTEPFTERAVSSTRIPSPRQNTLDFPRRGSGIRSPRSFTTPMQSTTMPPASSMNTKGKIRFFLYIAHTAPQLAHACLARGHRKIQGAIRRGLGSRPGSHVTRRQLGDGI